MADAQEKLRGLLLPLEDLSLVLPNSMVVHIMTKAIVAPYANAPPWLLGAVSWQKRDVPALSFEVAVGRRAPAARQTEPRLAIIKSLNYADKIPCYAVTMSATPHPVNLDAENIGAAENTVVGSPLVHSQVSIGGKSALVPNLDAMEQMLISQLALFEQGGRAQKS